MLKTLTLPVAEPAADGANCTPTDVLWFGESVTAPLPLTIEKPLPAIVSPETETLEFPVFVTVKLC